MKQWRLAVFFLAVLSFTVVWTGCGDDDSPAERKLVLTNYQPASLVLGQPDFTTGTTPSASLYTANLVYGMCAAGGRILFSEEGFNRITVYNSFPVSNYQPINDWLGQIDALSSTANRGGAVSANLTLNQPFGVHSDGTRLLICDAGNNRVLLYNTFPATYDAPADVVVGQEDFTTTTSTVSSNRLAYPYDAILAGGRLLVADGDNHRVLIWNSIPTTSGAPADIVLGQASFTNHTSNDDNQDGVDDGACSARTLYIPTDIWSDGNKVILCDQGNNRVLIWNTFPTTNFQPADVVVGQSSMTASGNGCSQTRFDYPQNIAVHAGQLLVSDYENSRVLLWDSIPTENGAPADVVLGQPDFTSGTYNNGGLSAGSLNNPASVLVIDDRVLVSDINNHRVLVYRSQQ